MKFFYERRRKRKIERKRIRKRDILGLCWFQDIEQKIRFKLGFNWMKKVFFASLTNDKNELKKIFLKWLFETNFFCFPLFKIFPQINHNLKFKHLFNLIFYWLLFHFKTFERFLIQGWVDFLKWQNSKE